MLKPGVDPMEMWMPITILEKPWISEETRLYAHGQGYDLVERPSFNR